MPQSKLDKHFPLILAGGFVLLMAILLLINILGSSGGGNPCDTNCERHPAVGTCHCHGHCTIAGCECHGAHHHH